MDPILYRLLACNLIIGVLSSFLFRDIMTSDCKLLLFSLVVFVCFVPLALVGFRISVAYVFVGVAKFLGLDFSFKYFHYDWIHG